jgi:hypothetical protein
VAAHERSRSRRIAALGLVLLGLLWVSCAPGLVSSNDGSHVALARALVVHGRTALHEEVALTLWVDRARQGGQDYSDRPPGTAFLAAPAVWLGARLDPVLLRASMESKDVVVNPAAPRYADTYAIRVQRQQQKAAEGEGGSAKAPPLLALQGTALFVALHCAVMGALGIAAVLLLLRRRGASPGAQAFAAASLGLACLWGPYSLVLFSHVTAGTCAIWALLGLELGLGGPGEPPAGSDSAAASTPSAPASLRRAPLVLAGLAAGWAFSADYLVALFVLGLGLAVAPPRRWLALAPWLLLGAAPIVAATLAYHVAAFGSPWSLGYDHHANFSFARERSATFDGNLLYGLWSQWGPGEGAGVLVLCPVMLVGLVGLAARRERWWLVGALPWILLLAAHHTPTGGAAADHRYLVPLMPVLAVGLGLAWMRWIDGSIRIRGRAIAALLVALALASAVLAWRHVLAVWA